MNLIKMAQVQDEYYQRVREIKNLEDASHIDVDIFALQVELGELANEWNEFKYWKTRDIEINEVSLIMEYVDCLSFLLNIGNRLEIINELNLSMRDTCQSGFDGIAAMFEAAQSFKNEMEYGNRADAEDEYVGMFNVFMGLADSFNFKYTEIEAAYYVKNTIRHRRLERK